MRRGRYDPGGWNNHYAFFFKAGKHLHQRAIGLGTDMSDADSLSIPFGTLDKTLDLGLHFF